LELHLSRADTLAVSHYIAMAQPRQQESGTRDLREFAGNASPAPRRFVAKKRDRLELLSHQLRTPLQAIFGYTELLEREIHGPLTDAQRRDVRGIQQSQQQLLGLIDSLATSRRK
jgi:signal transduction histidine kinase